MTWVPVKFTNPYMYIHISPFFFSTPPPPPKDVISVQILASQKGSKKLFHAAWFPWFAFWVVFPLFSTFYYYCCLPQTVFLQYSYICKSTYHRCAAFLASAFTLSPALPRSSESFTSSYVGHRVSRSQLCSERFCCLFASRPEKVQPYLFSNNVRAISRLTTCDILIFLDNSFSWDRFHSIPPTGFAALKSFCLLVQKLSVCLLLSAAATLWFRAVSHTSSSLSCIYLLSPLTFYLLNYLT